jgi:hypothetical protein
MQKPDLKLAKDYHTSYSPITRTEESECDGNGNLALGTTRNRHNQVASSQAHCNNRVCEGRLYSFNVL